MVILFSVKCFLFVYMYIGLLKLTDYKLFENSDADLSFLKNPNCIVLMFTGRRGCRFFTSSHSGSQQ